MKTGLILISLMILASCGSKSGGIGTSRAEPVGAGGGELKTCAVKFSQNDSSEVTALKGYKVRSVCGIDTESELQKKIEHDLSN